MVIKKLNRFYKTLFYATLGLSILGTTLWVGIPQGVSGLTCCSYGADCVPPGGGEVGAEQVCCNPATNQAPCSSEKPDYCRTAC